MEKYRAVFCDIDGTLLTSDHRVTPDTAKKIRDLSERGIPFILTSSRMPAAMYSIQREIGFRGSMIGFGRKREASFECRAFAGACGQSSGGVSAGE